jgi:hypothetical protein
MDPSDKVRVYQGPAGETFEVERQLYSVVDVDGLRDSLEMPSYIDLTGSAMQRALVAIWASATAPATFGAIPEGRKLDSLIQPLLMGGAAVKVLSPSANLPGGPLNRKIHDLDFVLPRSQAGKFVQALCLLEAVAGSKFKHFLTSTDRRFNALRAGERYRVRGIDWGDAQAPVASVVDIFVEKIEMRHTVSVHGEFSRAKANMHSIGFEKLMMTKCQLISDFDARDVRPTDGLDVRVLRWPHYREGRLIVGMEEKDMKDVCALLLDGGESGRLDVERLRRELNDQKLLLTVRLNLENLLSREDWMKGKGLSAGQISHVKETGSRILRALPEVDKKWSKPWWNTEVETPSVS